MFEITPILKLGLLFFASSCLYYLVTRKKLDNRYPPIVQIPAVEQFTNTRAAYEEVLRKHGPVVGVWRKGRLEYIIGKQYVKHVLTRDDIFSFEEGTFEVLNLNFLLAFNGRKFFRDVEDTVINIVARPLKEVTDRIFPIVERRTREYIDSACAGHHLPQQGADFKDFCHQVVVENMMSITFGKSLESAHLKTVETLEIDLATMTGMFQNTGYFSRTFPNTWKFFVTMRVLFFSVLPGFLFVLGPPIWSSINAFEKTLRNTDVEASDFMPAGVVQVLAKKWVDPKSGRVTFPHRLWIVAIISGFIFSSVHNTTNLAAWVMYQLAQRPEYLPQLREELLRISGGAEFPLNSSSLKAATHLDSFIREVLRLRGDTISQVRRTTCDAALGKYIIPKGQLVTPLATTVNEDPEVYGDGASTFDGFRWVQQEKPAVMIGPSYIPFGLGRFACPGRGLAITEVKLLILAFIAKATPTLKEGSYKITDPMNTAAIAPDAILLVQPLDVPLY